MIRKLVLFISILLISFHVSAYEVGILVGGTKFKQADDGRWWQQYYPHELQTKSESIGLELITPIKQNLDFKVGFVYLGSAHSKGYAVPDENYDVVHHVCTTCWTDPSLFEGHGTVNGLYFLLVPKYKYNEITFFTEIGGWLYKPTWYAKLTDYHSHSLDNPGIYYVQHDSKIVPGIVGGIGFSFKNITLGFRKYKAEAAHDQYPALYTKTANTLYVEYRY